MFLSFSELCSGCELVFDDSGLDSSPSALGG